MRYAAVGKCIYCGSSSVELTDEHIIPLALGGDDIIPRASCKDCERITGTKIEHPCLRRILLAPRTHWEIKSRRPKDRPTELRIGTGTPAVNFEWKSVPVPQHPLAFGLPVFAPPGILIGAARTRGFMMFAPWAYMDKHAEERMKRHGDSAGIYQPFSPDLFCRMVAKIAHCQAAATLGVDAFDPFLPGIILGRTEIISYYVGNAAHIQHATPPATSLSEITHELYLGERASTRDGQRMITAIVRLFANLNAPGYEVIVGFPRA